MQTALVLGAGGLTGQAFHLGVLTALTEAAGWDPLDADILVGTSAGSLVAAALAAGLSASDQCAELLGEALSPQGQGLRTASFQTTQPPSAELPPLPRRRPLAPGAVLAVARRPWGVRPGSVASALLPAGQQSTEPIARSVRGLYGERRWPDRDLRLCAVRARDARRVVFGTPGAPEVDVGTAVAASCAIPAYFTPVRAAGEVFLDGGMHSPTNADVVVRDHPELVIVSSPMSVGRGAVRPRRDLAIRLALRRYLAIEVRRLRRAGCAVVVLQPGPADLDVMGVNPMRLASAAEVIGSARDTVTARLRGHPQTAELLGRSPGWSEPHR